MRAPSTAGGSSIAPQLIRPPAVDIERAAPGIASATGLLTKRVVRSHVPRFASTRGSRLVLNGNPLRISLTGCPCWPVVSTTPMPRRVGPQVGLRVGPATGVGPKVGPKAILAASLESQNRLISRGFGEIAQLVEHTTENHAINNVDGADITFVKGTFRRFPTLPDDVKHPGWVHRWVHERALDSTPLLEVSLDRPRRCSA